VKRGVTTPYTAGFYKPTIGVKVSKWYIEPFPRVKQTQPQRVQPLLRRDAFLIPSKSIKFKISRIASLQPR